MKRRLKRFNISNKLAYTLIIVALIVGLGIGVYALSPGVAPNPGHTIDVVAPPSGCSAGQVLTWSGNSWSCTTTSGGVTKSVALYKCPVDPIATNYCANILLLRNGISPCVGQLTTNSGSGCYIVDVNCNFDPVKGIGSWGSCSTLVGYLVS